MQKIIILMDGTWQDGGEIESRSNIKKIELLLAAEDKNGVQQIRQYFSGVGTGDFKDKVRGGATGAGIRKKICDAYRFLCEHYSENDEIHIIGFSRGAHSARSLVGLIELYGLLPKQKIDEVNRVWENYRNRSQASEPELDKKENRMPLLQSLVVFDTVGALGIPIVDKNLESINKEYAFHNVKTCTNVEHIFHALAIDERRLSFIPTLLKEMSKLKS